MKTTKFSQIGKIFIVAIFAFQIGVIGHAARNQTIYDISMFADKKARKIGDLLTVLVNESASASREAKTATNRSSSQSGGIDALVGLPLGDLSQGINLKSGTNFAGSGSKTHTDTFKAIVPVIVIEIDKNGNLIVEGQRQISIGGDKQRINVRGLVRSSDISAQNTIISTNLANAEITYEGEGMIDRQQKPGWLSRFLDWIWIF